MVSGRFGPLPGPDQTVPISELFAMPFTLKTTFADSVTLCSDDDKYVEDKSSLSRGQTIFGRNGDIGDRV